MQTLPHNPKSATFISIFCWLALALTIGSSPLQGQTVADDFSDGNLNANPAWVGQVSSFDLVGGRLHLNAPGLDHTAALSTAFLRNLTSAATEWQLWVQLSTPVDDVRQLRYYLTSNNSTLSGAFDGYFISFGDATGDGRLRLVRQTGTLQVTVLQSAVGYLTQHPTLRVRVRRSAGTTATWELAADPEGGRDFTVLATTLETGLFLSVHCGLVFRYTAGSRRHFAVDDLLAGTAPADISGPVLRQAEALTATSVQATFDEPVTATPAASGFNLSGIGTAVSAVRELQNRAAVRLTFATPLPVGQGLTLSATTADLTGHSASSQSTFTWWSPILPAPGDVSIVILLS